MGVTIGKKKLSNGRTSLFLDFNYNGIRKKEYLGIVLDNPTTKDVRESNKERFKLADAIRAKRELETVAVDYEVNDLRMNRNFDFLKFYKMYVDKYKKNDVRLVVASYVQFMEYTGKKSISSKEVTKEVCIGFRDFLLDKFNGITPGSYFKKFKMCLRAAVENKLFNESPAKDITVVSSEELSKDVLTFDEIQLLSQTPCGNDDVKRAFLLSCNTGLRWCDVKELRYKDIDMDARRLKITQEKVRKTSKHATVYIDLNSSAITILSIKSGTADEKVFQLPSHTAGLKNLRYWVQRAGISKHITYHCARHSFCTNLMYSGANLKTTAALAGHSSTRHTEKYAHVVDDLKRKAVDALPEIKNITLKST